MQQLPLKHRYRQYGKTLLNTKKQTSVKYIPKFIVKTRSALFQSVKDFCSTVVSRPIIFSLLILIYVDLISIYLNKIPFSYLSLRKFIISNNIRPPYPYYINISLIIFSIYCYHFSFIQYYFSIIYPFILKPSNKNFLACILLGLFFSVKVFKYFDLLYMVPFNVLLVVISNRNFKFVIIGVYSLMFYFRSMFVLPNDIVPVCNLCTFYYYLLFDFYKNKFVAHYISPYLALDGDIYSKAHVIVFDQFNVKESYCNISALN